MKKHPLSDPIKQAVAETCPALLDTFMQAVYDNFDHPMKDHPAFHGRIMAEIKNTVQLASQRGMLTIGTMKKHDGAHSQEFTVVRSAPKPQRATKIIYLPSSE